MDVIITERGGGWDGEYMYKGGCSKKRFWPFSCPWKPETVLLAWGGGPPPPPSCYLHVFFSLRWAVVYFRVRNHVVPNVCGSLLDREGLEVLEARAFGFFRAGPGLGS